MSRVGLDRTHNPTLLLAILATTALAACTTVGPDYRPASPQTPAAFAEPHADGAVETTDWWRTFNDPDLNRLVAAALARNLDLQSAASHIREARLQEAVAGAAGKPQVQVDVQAGRTRLSEHAIALPPGADGGGGGGGFGLPGSTFDTFKLGFDASWEIDLFGGVRRGVEAARARTGAAEWNARDLQVAIGAETAAHYLSLRALQQRIEIAQAQTRRQGDTLAIVRARADAGLTSQLDTEQQASLERATAAAAAPLMAQAEAEIHAIAVLTGQAPEALAESLAAPSAQPVPPPAPPAGLPSDLLRRRPDLRRAERNVAAASADIGLATAALYPRISLTAQPTMASTDLSNLLQWGSRQYSIGAGLLWPVLEGGRIRAQIGQANERQTQALLAYRKSVLTALQDVEDALARYAAEQARMRDLAAAVERSRAAEALARDQYRAGLTNYAPVLIAQGSVMSAEDQLAASRGALNQDLVALYKALGGGWTEQDIAGGGS